MVIWNGCGRPDASNAIASPSSTTRVRRQPAHRFDDFRNGRADLVQSARVNAHLVRRLVHLDARPVHFPLERRLALELEERLAHVGGGLREHGRDGREQLELELYRALRVRRCSAACATAPRLFAYIAARRTALAGSSAAAAIASSMTPARAPWRSSPSKSRARNSRSAGCRARPQIAQELRAAAGGARAFDCPAVEANVASTSADGERRGRSRPRCDGGRRERSVADAEAALRGLSRQIVNGRVHLDRAASVCKQTPLARALSQAAHAWLQRAATWRRDGRARSLQSCAGPSTVRNSSKQRRCGAAGRMKGLRRSSGSSWYVRHGILARTRNALTSAKSARAFLLRFDQRFVDWVHR